MMRRLFLGSTPDLQVVHIPQPERFACFINRDRTGWKRENNVLLKGIWEQEFLISSSFLTSCPPRSQTTYTRARVFTNMRKMCKLWKTFQVTLISFLFFPCATGEIVLPRWAHSIAFICSALDSHFGPLVLGRFYHWKAGGSSVCHAYQWQWFSSCGLCCLWRRPHIGAVLTVAVRVVQVWRKRCDDIMRRKNKRQN